MLAEVFEVTDPDDEDCSPGWYWKGNDKTEPEDEHGPFETSGQAAVDALAHGYSARVPWR